MAVRLVKGVQQRKVGPAVEPLGSAVHGMPIHGPSHMFPARLCVAGVRRRHVAFVHVSCAYAPSPGQNAHHTAG